MSDSAENVNFDLIKDVRVGLSVQLGSCELPMREVVELTDGAVIQLKQEAKDPVGLYVNQKLIAYGEVVVVDDNFGIKITQILGNVKETADSQA